MKTGYVFDDHNAPRSTTLARGMCSIVGNFDALSVNIFLIFANFLCEWCYVVDLDAGALEVYRGQSAGRVSRQMPPYRSVGFIRAERFAGVTGQVLQAVFRFDDLPGDEDAFMAACGGVRSEDGYFDWSL
jgi:hypothetical protein